MASIEIVDNGDGTGAVATISGLIGAGTLHARSFTGDLASDEPFVIQTSVVDGDQTLSLGVGSYFAVVVDDDGPTQPIGFRVRDTSIGVHHACHLAIRELVLSMNLPAFQTDPNLHVIHKRPKETFTELLDETNGDVHGVHYWKRIEERSLTDNQRTMVRYPIEIVSVQSNQFGFADLPDWTLARELVSRAAEVGYPLPGVPCVHTIDVVPGVIYGNDDITGVDIQSMTFYCGVEQPHGLN